jgi:hypothetical protein
MTRDTDEIYEKWLREQSELNREIMDDQEAQNRYYDEMMQDAQEDLFLNPVSFPLSSPTIDDTSITKDIDSK